ncbi:MAG: alpha/beta hydrolase [Polyangiales bacterium]
MRRALLVAVCVLCACGDDDDREPTPPRDAATDSAQPAPIDGGLPVLDAALAPDAAALTWSACGDAGYQCASFPSDNVRLALTKLPARGARLGSLVWNPGGPGASAIDYMPALVDLLSAQVLERYDVIAVDPRGVGHSDPILCHDKLQQLYSVNPSPESEPQWAAVDAVAKQFADDCANKYPRELLASLGTERVVADFELLRQRLGEDKLNYLGFSYGTAIGARYAAAHPDKVGRFVLDAPVDLALDPFEISLQQARSFEQALSNYFAWCNAERCPWAKGDPRTTFNALLQQVEATPLPGTDRPCGPGELVQGVVAFLYGGEQGWEVISDDLTLASEGDGSGLVDSTDLYLERDLDTGVYSNITEANYAVNCLDDDPLTLAQIRAQEAAFRSAAPIFGMPILTHMLVCAHWPAQGKKPAAPSNVTSAPFMVIGTTQDPATPFAWAQATAQRLGPSAHLFTYDGEGHTAYAREIPCVDAVVDAYLLNGTLPAAPARCDARAALVRSAHTPAALIRR